MAVTKSSDIKSKQPVDEGAGPSCREGEDAGPSRLVQLRKSDRKPIPSCRSDKGAKSEYQGIDKDTCEMAKRSNRRRKRSKDDEVDSLSDIDDAEVFGYFNTKEEIQIKRILWEAINGNYTKGKKQKRTTERKKGAPVKKAAKPTEEKSQKLSSRINYDALKMLNDEFEQASEATQAVGADSNRSGNSKGNGNLDHHDGDMYYEYGDDGDEFFDF